MTIAVDLGRKATKQTNKSLAVGGDFCGLLITFANSTLDPNHKMSGLKLILEKQQQAGNKKAHKITLHAKSKLAELILDSTLVITS